MEYTAWPGEKRKERRHQKRDLEALRGANIRPYSLDRQRRSS